MALCSSYFTWKCIEKLESEKRIRLLQWQLRAREPIRRFSDMKVGDHLVRKGSSTGGSLKYEHYFLCVGFDCKRKPKIIHYYKTDKTKKWKVVVQLMTLPHKDFIKNEGELQAKGSEVERVVWPEELKHFSVQEVIRRALKRMGEDKYNLILNNCESLVMWCLCDLKISLQVQQVPKPLLHTFMISLLMKDLPVHMFTLIGTVSFIASHPELSLTRELSTAVASRPRLQLALP